MKDIRIGNGIDFHRLIENEERPLLLGGVEFPGILALEGHSDADVLLHAVSDALLGSLAEGDIGILFPDTDPKWKNLDSTVILDESLNRILNKGYRLSNMDITVISEVPRISPMREKIVWNLAGLCSIAPDRISLKATTSEKMGALGRKEGICVLATVLVMSE